MSKVSGQNGSSTNGKGQAAPTASQIGTRVWSYAGVLKDDGLSYMAYVEQLTFLLFLKMADELTRPPYNRPNKIPQGKTKNGKPIDYDWPSLLTKDGAELYQHYRDVLDSLSTQPGLLGVIFKEAECKIKDPAKLRRLIFDLIDRESWLSLDLDVRESSTKSCSRAVPRKAPAARDSILHHGQQSSPSPRLDFPGGGEAGKESWAPWHGCHSAHLR